MGSLGASLLFRNLFVVLELGSTHLCKTLNIGCGLFLGLRNIEQPFAQEVDRILWLSLVEYCHALGDDTTELVGLDVFGLLLVVKCHLN